MFSKSVLNAVVVAVSVTAVSAIRAQQYVYPAKGQSPQKQKTDEGECHTWAVQQSKYDPTKPPPQTAAAIRRLRLLPAPRPARGRAGRRAGRSSEKSWRRRQIRCCCGRSRGSWAEPPAERGAGATATASRDAARPGGHGLLSESARGVPRGPWLYGEVSELK